MIIASQIDPTAKDSILQVAPAQAQERTMGMMAIPARVDDPPPYAPSQVFQSPRRPIPPIPRTISNTSDPRSKPPNVATNFLFVKTRQEPVNGVFCIDPELQAIAPDKEGATATDRREYNRTHRQRHHHHSRKGFKKRTDLPDPNAIFETRQGAIQLDISVVASPPAATHSRTLIQATARQGPVDIKVHSIHPKRRLNMEVRTRKGDILVLIPRSFSGYIQLYSRHGQLVFLPSLASAMSLVARHEREVQAVVGDVVNRLPATGTEWSGDTVHIASRHGDILIGYIGEDNKPAAEPGFWKKLAHIFQPSTH
ncbi:hypothetical protein JB92DRAFT_1271842 [Gautieria morchelliformis]|nr:hypothetical protein JB92DRAFT_1271842 [Gautieria morchelliformis]